MNATIERAVLCSLILRSRLFDAEGVDAMLFRSSDHRKIFRHASRLCAIDKGPEISLVRLGELCARDGIPQTYVSSLIDAPKPGFEKEFPGLVLELRKARLNDKIATLLSRQAQAGNFDISEIRADLEELDQLDRPVTSCSNLGEIKPKTISWIWNGRIPLGMLTLIAGDPGLGKSFLSIWICSRLSRGATFPDNTAPAITGGSIYLPAEDSAAYAIRPRADANQADASKIYILEDSSLDIVKDLKRIRAKLDEDPAIKQLVIDPLNSFLGQVDYFKDTSVRAVLAPLCRFIEERNIACIGIMHLNKKIDLGGIYRIGGSIAFSGVARSVLAVTAHPEDETKRLFRPLKMNYAKKPHALAFSIGDDLRLSFDDKPVLIDQNDSLSLAPTQEGTENSFATEWLRDRLADGGAELKDIIKDASEVQISRRTLFYCRKKLGLASRASGRGTAKTARWELP